MTVCIIFFLGHWFLSLFCQSFYLHRFCSHQMFNMNPFWQRFFHGLTFIAQGSSYLDPNAYAQLHRQHHQYSDTKKDPHSPRYFSSPYQLMKQTYWQYQAQTRESRHQWGAFDRLANSAISRIIWVLIYISIYLYYQQYLLLVLLVPIHILMGPIHGALVNWCGHKYGYRNYHLSDQSYNTFFWDIFLMGEWFQNNHHQSPHRLNFAHKWFEIDPTFLLTKVMSFFHIIKIPNGAIHANRKSFS